jgi:hypothetical protein
VSGPSPPKLQGKKKNKKRYIYILLIGPFQKSFGPSDSTAFVYLSPVKYMLTQTHLMK